jgi:hypothetical protein
MPPRLKIVLACALAAFAAGFAPAGASAYEIAGRAWPSGEIRYHIQDDALRTPVKRAAKIWNRRGLSVRFVSSDADSARVFIRIGQRNCGGAARVGYPGRRGVSGVEINRDCGTGIATLTAVHEFGHVLGLGHEGDACARMNPTFGAGGTPGRCKRNSLSYWLDHPLTKDDVRGARAMY